jgi:hypothetical protein
MPEQNNQRDAEDKPGSTFADQQGIPSPDDPRSK